MATITSNTERPTPNPNHIIVYNDCSLEEYINDHYVLQGGYKQKYLILPEPYICKGCGMYLGLVTTQFKCSECNTRTPNNIETIPATLTRLERMYYLSRYHHKPI